VLGRERVRAHLAGRPADRRPFLPFATALAARLDQVPPEQLLDEASSLTRALAGAQSLLDLDAVIVDVPPPALTAAGIAVVGEAVLRLRASLGDRAALVLALPGPRTLAEAGSVEPTPDALDDFGAGILAAANELDPHRADCLAIVERAALPDEAVGALDEALSPLWNAARYYALPSLFVAAQAGPAAARIGSDAISIWSGVTPDELVAAGRGPVGVTVEVGLPPPLLPPGGFYTTAGDLPADTDLEALRALLGAMAAA
jgi:hypothetical protein